MIGRAGKTGTIAAKNKGIIGMAKRIAYRANYRGPDHVDILEPASCDGFGRSGNIGCADPPVIWQFVID